MNENGTLASELLREVKASAKRWFIISMVELLMLLGMGTALIWYMTLPAEEYNVKQESTQGSYNIINTGEGDVNNGKAEDNLQTPNSEK